MTRQREIPSIQYRSPNQINMVFPILPGVPKIRVYGAARLNDAYGNVAGVGGGGVLPMFEVQSGATFISPSLKARKLPAVEETNRGLTRMVFDPDDFATPAQPAGTTYLPTDDQSLFIRIALWNPTTGGWNPPGPIMIIPPLRLLHDQGAGVHRDGEGTEHGSRRVARGPPGLPPPRRC